MNINLQEAPATVAGLESTRNQLNAVLDQITQRERLVRRVTLGGVLAFFVALAGLWYFGVATSIGVMVTLGMLAMPVSTLGGGLNRSVFS